MKRTFWIVYQTKHNYRNDITHSRRDSKKVVIEGYSIKWDTRPKTRLTKQKNKKYGIKVTYKKMVNVKGGNKAEKEFTKIISLPKDARNIEVRTSPPKFKNNIQIW